MLVQNHTKNFIVATLIFSTLLVGFFTFTSSASATTVIYETDRGTAGIDSGTFGDSIPLTEEDDLHYNAVGFGYVGPDGEDIDFTEITVNNYALTGGGLVYASLYEYYSGSDHLIATSTNTYDTEGADHDLFYPNGKDIVFYFEPTTLEDGHDYIFHIADGGANVNWLRSTHQGLGYYGTWLKMEYTAPPDTTKYIYLYHPTSSEVLADFSNWGTRHYYGNANMEYPYSKICINSGPTTNPKKYSDCQWIGPLSQNFGNMSVESTWAILKNRFLSVGEYKAESILYGYDGEDYWFIASSTPITFTIDKEMPENSLYRGILEDLTPDPDTCYPAEGGWFESNYVASSTEYLWCNIKNGSKSILVWLFVPGENSTSFIKDQFGKATSTFPFSLYFGMTSKIQTAISTTTQTIGGISIELAGTPRFGTTTIPLFSSSGIAVEIGQTAWNAYSNFVLIALSSAMVVALMLMI